MVKHKYHISALMALKICYQLGLKDRKFITINRCSLSSGILLLMYSLSITKFINIVLLVSPLHYCCTLSMGTRYSSARIAKFFPASALNTTTAINFLNHSFTIRTRFHACDNHRIDRSPLFLKITIEALMLIFSAD